MTGHHEGCDFVFAFRSLSSFPISLIEIAPPSFPNPQLLLSTNLRYRISNQFLFLTKGTPFPLCEGYPPLGFFPSLTPQIRLRLYASQTPEGKFSPFFASVPPLFHSTGEGEFFSRGLQLPLVHSSPFPPFSSPSLSGLPSKDMISLRSFFRNFFSLTPDFVHSVVTFPSKLSFGLPPA